MQIVICDDEQHELKAIRKALDTYREAHPEYSFDIDEYSAPLDVLHAVDKEKHMILPFWIFVCRGCWGRMSRRKCLLKARIWELFF